MNVPLLDVKAQYKPIRAEILKAVETVVDSGMFINGPAVKELEAAIAKYSDCAAAVGVSSGTDALLCALMALGIGAGDEVITTPYTFFATAGCIWRTGAKPVFVDIEPDTFNLDATQIASAINKNTKAILPVHLFGQMCDMDAIMAIAGEHKLAVIEDAAQSIGSAYKGRKAGSIGTCGCFSFFPSKNLGCMGDGGAIVTQNADFAERLLVFRNHGSKPKYYHKFVGGNFRIDTLQAAALLVKLPHLDAWSAKRRANGAKYDAMFRGFAPVTTPVIREGNQTIYNQYVIRLADRQTRDGLQNFLKEQGIGTEVYYPLSLHEQECFKSLGYERGDFPESEKAADESLALPIYSELTDEQMEYVAGKIKEYLG